MICRVCLVGREVPPLLISPCSDCWVLVKMSMLVYAGKPWGGVTVTDRDVASAAACRGGRRHFVSLEIQKKNKSFVLVDKVYSGSTYREHQTN